MSWLRRLELPLVGLAWLLLLFGVPDGTPWGIKDAVASLLIAAVLTHRFASDEFERLGRGSDDQ